MTQQITQGDRVQFQHAEHGFQKGLVLGLLLNIENHQTTAIVKLDHQLDGVVMHILLNELQREIA